LVSVTSFDGNFDVYSIEGSGKAVARRKESKQSNAISDAFGIQEDLPEMKVENKENHEKTESAEAGAALPKIKICPKWNKKQVACARFGFGGKLITVTNKNKVTLYQLSASEHLKVKTQELVHAVKSPEMVKEYCLVKGDQNSFWKLLGARLRGNAALIEELGYNPESAHCTLWGKICAHAFLV